jgi:hypothetical protein
MMSGALKQTARFTGLVAGRALLGCALILGGAAALLMALAGTINEHTDT